MTSGTVPVSSIDFQPLAVGDFAAGEAMSSHRGPVDLAEVARGLGALGVRVDRGAESEEVLQRGLAERVPVVGGLPGQEG